MTDASLVVTAGSGTNIHTSTRSYSGTTKHDQYVLQAEADLPSYVTTSTATYSVATADGHFQLMAGSSLAVRVRYIHIGPGVSATTAGVQSFEIWRLSTAGSGGTAYTPRPLDTADSAAGATSMALPSSKGTETVLMGRRVLEIRQSYSTLGGAEGELNWVYYGFGMKSLLIPAGTSNGIAIKHTAAMAGATVAVEIGFIETSFV